MLFRKALTLAALAGLLAAPLASAQDAGTARIGVCNPGRVFESMHERTAVQDRVRAERTKAENEEKQKRAELLDIQNQLNNLKPGTPPHQARQKEYLEKIVGFEVWQRVRQAELARLEKEQIRMLFDKIIEASKEVAVQRKLDIVLAERRPELQNFDQLTPDQLRQLLGQRDVLYLNEKADITDPVIAEVNRRYAAGAGGAAPIPTPEPPK